MIRWDEALFNFVGITLGALLSVVLGLSAFFQPDSLEKLLTSFGFVLMIVLFSFNCDQTRKAISRNNARNILFNITVFAIYELGLVLWLGIRGAMFEPTFRLAQSGFQAALIAFLLLAWFVFCCICGLYIKRK